MLLKLVAMSLLWVMAQGKCYNVTLDKRSFILVLNEITWFQAKQFCEATPGRYIATIRNSTDNDLLRVILSKDTWIGYNDISQEGIYQWDHGTSNYFNNITGNNENSDCAVLTGSGGWQPRGCTQTFHFLCQYDSLDGSCPPCIGANEVLLDGRCFRRMDTLLSWSAAQSVCESLPCGKLATLRTNTDYNATSLLALPAMWIGLSRYTAEWVWSDPSSTFQANWTVSSDPSANCVQFVSGSWKNVDCSQSFPFLCQLDEPCLLPPSPAPSPVVVPPPAPQSTSPVRSPVVSPSPAPVPSTESAPLPSPTEDPTPNCPPYPNIISNCINGVWVTNHFNSVTDLILVNTGLIVNGGVSLNGSVLVQNSTLTINGDLLLYNTKLVLIGNLTISNSLNLFGVTVQFSLNSTLLVNGNVNLKTTTIMIDLQNTPLLGDLFLLNTSIHTNITGFPNLILKNLPPCKSATLKQVNHGLLLAMQDTPCLLPPHLIGAILGALAGAALLIISIYNLHRKYKANQSFKNLKVEPTF